MTVSLDTLSSPILHDPASLLDYFTRATAFYFRHMNCGKFGVLLGVP